LRVDDPAVARVLLHPLRADILARMREPASASEVARDLGLPPARVNHHVQRLREAGLLRRAGSRRIRNLREMLYVARARTFTVAESVTPGGDRRKRLREDEARRPLRNLVALGERLAGDSLHLLDEAAWQDREFSTFATALDLSFPDASSRAAFLADLLAAVKSLRDHYGADRDAPPAERYTAVIACYPESGS
jgi:DNA-binding transcriptional ArsR family regulator